MHDLFVTIMVTTKRPRACIQIDSLVSGKVLKYIHTACLDVH